MKAQIEADKKARAEKAAREKALREGKPLPGVEQASGSGATPNAAPASAAPKTAGRDYPETRLQIRMASGGQPYTTTLPSDASAWSRCLRRVWARGYRDELTVRTWPVPQPSDRLRSSLLGKRSRLTSRLSPSRSRSQAACWERASAGGYRN